MSEYALPHIGKRPVDGISPADVLSFLAPVAVAKPSVAKKVKMGLSQTFKWAIAQGLMSVNPPTRISQRRFPGCPHASTIAPCHTHVWERPSE